MKKKNEKPTFLIHFYDRFENIIHYEIFSRFGAFISEKNSSISSYVEVDVIK